MVFIGFNIDKELLEKIKVIKFVSNKTQTELILEGLNIVVEKYSDDFEKFKQYAKKFEKE